MISIGLVDDHRLLLKSLRNTLEQDDNFRVSLEAINGKDLQEKITSVNVIPDIILVDVIMPVMDGVSTVKWLNQHYPLIKLVALSSNDEEKTIIAMIRACCCAYLSKSIDFPELEVALNEIYTKGYYNSDAINYRRLLMMETEEESLNISPNEKQFLQLACSDLTYMQIASKMFLSPKTIDGYRNSLFEKMKVKSRVGLALEAIRKGLVKL